MIIWEVLKGWIELKKASLKKKRALTEQASPPSDVAGFIIGEHKFGLGKTRSHDGIREVNGGLELDQGDVITGQEMIKHCI